MRRPYNWRDEMFANAAADAAERQHADAEHAAAAERVRAMLPTLAAYASTTAPPPRSTWHDSENFRSAWTDGGVIHLDEHLEPITCQTCGEQLTVTNLCGCDEPVESWSRGEKLLLAVLVALALALTAAVFSAGTFWRQAAPASSDGRYAPCGVVTEHGVTEHLDEYARRCQ